MPIKDSGISLPAFLGAWLITVLAGGAVGFFYGHKSGVSDGYKKAGGLEVKPVAIADFNNDGIRDIVYRRRVCNGFSAFIFVDGRDASEREGRYYIHSEGAPICEIRDEEYNVLAPDIDCDGNADISIIPADLKTDLFNLKLWCRYGDGKGNFKEKPPEKHEKKDL